jgi:hypothetical protein
MKRWLCLIILWAGVSVFAQEEANAEFFSNTASVEETLIYRLPIGDVYLLSITGERLVNRTFMKFEVLYLDGSPIPAGIPARIEFDYNQQIDGERQSVPMVVELIYSPERRLYYHEPLTFENPGAIQGSFIIGEPSNELERQFSSIQVYPRRPLLEAWFAPLNLAIPFVLLGIILFLFKNRVLLKLRSI